MTDAQKKSQETRQNTQKSRAQLMDEESKAIRLMRLALQRILESEDASTGQILEATQLLSKLVHPRYR